MPPAVLENGALRLTVLPEAGASVVGLELRRGDAWLPVMRPTPSAAIESLNSSDMASFVLAPYSNRIRDARFSFQGKEYRLRPNTPDGHTIHGDVRKRPWKVRSVERERIALSFDSRDFADINFPFHFTVDLAYALRGERCDTEIALRNAGDSALPAGVGFHPYFRRTLLDPDEQVQLEARVTGAYPELVPTTPPRPIAPREDFSRSRPLGDVDLDTCFAGWDGRARITWPGSAVVAEIECDAALSHLIVYTPPGKAFFAVEPVSNANNGFNLLAAGIEGSGVAVLGPGEELRARFGLSITPSGAGPRGRRTPSA
jgi:aldose 1-epimerase